MSLKIKNVAKSSSAWFLLEVRHINASMESFFEDRLGENYDDENDFNESCDNSKLLLDVLPDLEEDIDNNNKKKSKNKKFNLTDMYLITNYKNRRDDTPSEINKILQKSNMGPGFEKQISLPPPTNSKIAKLERKKLREKTKGKKWYDIPATEMTTELKNDFQILKMRDVLDQKRVYKNKTITSIPKYFQVGRVLDSPADFYTGRIVKSQRKKTMVEELLADAECKSYQKKKFKEIMDTNRRKYLKNKRVENKKGKKGNFKK